MKILAWHVHGSWMNSFVRGPHEYIVPVTPDRGPDGRGRARTWEWPDSVREVPPSELAMTEPDVVVLQRPHEFDLVNEWLNRRPGVDLPAVYVEHNTPRADVPCQRHHVSDRHDVTLVHVTDFNALMWDAGTARAVVIEHGVVDPGYRYTGTLSSAAVVVNEPVRRGRVAGTDLLPGFTEIAHLDVFGMQVDGVAAKLGVAPARLTAHEDLPQDALHHELSRRRVYLHVMRWTSLGLSLIEAMLLGMPIVALATTAAPDAVPRAAGVVSQRPSELKAAVSMLLSDFACARQMGQAARLAALTRFGLDRFLADWDRLLREATA